MRRLYSWLAITILIGSTFGCTRHDFNRDDRSGDGVCDLSKCPNTDKGMTCCTPNGECGYDSAGTGLTCTALHPSGVCDLETCPVPDIGIPCCTNNAQCGVDLFATGQLCFANPPPNNVEPPNCNKADCPKPDVGIRCCIDDNTCGYDVFSIGLCGPIPEPLPVFDAGDPYSPPDDPSVTGECPSYQGALGPVWGCCSPIGVCGTFQSNQCLIPVGTPLPVGDEDAGLPLGGAHCTPPKMSTPK